MTKSQYLSFKKTTARKKIYIQKLRKKKQNNYF